jgi:hypothetical protein
MEQTLNPSQTSQILVAKKMLALENQFKNGINQFYWIAGLSLVNTLIFLTGGSMTFVIGLGITQVIDGITSGLTKVMGSTTGSVITGVGFLLDLIVAGLFILFGVLGRKRFGKVILCGIVLYAMDGLIFLFASDWPGLFFHLFMLVGLGKGYMALNNLKKLEESQTSGDIEEVQKLLAVTPDVQNRTPVDNKKRIRNLVIFTLILLIPFGLFLLIMFTSVGK